MMSAIIILLFVVLLESNTGKIYKIFNEIA